MQRIKDNIPNIVLSLAAASFIISGLFPNAVSIAGKVNCDTIGDWDKAQEIYKSDPKAYRALDRDSDGEACEALK